MTELDNLTSLNLNNNLLKSLEMLTNLKGLGVVRLYNNQLNDIEPLANLHGLYCLDLRRNEISDISPLVKNHGLGKDIVNTIELTDNPLSADSLDIYIPQLKQRRVKVIYNTPHQ
ncbi:leucine-rich repeat domain-containing protein [Chloroflexota bacterium]